MQGSFYNTTETGVCYYFPNCTRSIIRICACGHQSMRIKGVVIKPSRHIGLLMRLQLCNDKIMKGETV